MNTTIIAAFLTPIVWMLLQHYVTGPLENLAKKKLPPKLAHILTKKRGEKDQ